MFFSSNSSSISHFVRCPALAALLVLAWTIDGSAQQPLELNPYTSNLEFGIIANENGICRMNDRGNLIGLNGQSCLGEGSRAIFTLSGDPGSVVFIEATGSTASGITFTPDVVGSSTRVIPASGNTYVVISGDLQLQNANSGVHSLDYLLCVHYE